jgi:hypothetical protein
MAELKEEHFEVIDGNRQRAYEERKIMRRDLIEFIEKCDSYKLMKLYDEYKRLKK